MILQLNPGLYLKTEKGDGIAHFIIDYGIEHDLYWVIFLESGEIWTFKNSEVRAEPNWTENRQREDVVKTIERIKKYHRDQSNE